MTYCSVVAVLDLVGLTKKRFGHYAILNFFPSDDQVYKGAIIKYITEGSGRLC